MSGRILVVDDDADIRDLTRLTLASVGFSVQVAAGGLEAIELLRSELPDLVILDIMMPHISGWEVLDFLKNNDETAGIPVMLMTARDQPDDIKAGYDYGATYYLTKPWSTAELLYAVGVALGRPDLITGEA